MPAKQYRVFLNGKKRSELKRLVSTGTNKARRINRARILLLSDESPGGKSEGMGKTDKEIIESLGQKFCKCYQTATGSQSMTSAFCESE